MIHSLAITLSLTFLALALIHVYWGLGGTWGVKATIPTQEDDTSLFSPGPFACYVVAAGLLSFSYISLVQVALLPAPVGTDTIKWVTLAMSLLFGLRAIGDFRYAGLFKRIRNTHFSRYDTMIFTPLCILLSSGLFMLSLNG